MLYTYTMKTFLSLLANIALCAAVAYGVFFLVSPNISPVPQNKVGTFNPTGGGTYRLQSSIGGSDTSLTLTSFKEPTSAIPYTMTYLNSSIEYATVEPQSNNKEFISFTGITQNSDGTATLTGLARGLGFSYPFTASTTLQQPHSGQSILILSNPPQLYNQFYNLGNVGTSTNYLIVSSTTPPHYDATGVQKNGSYISTTSELASVDYVNAVALVSAPNGSTGAKGVYQTATALQQASSTATGSTGAALTLTSATATDTPQYGCAVGYTGTAGAACNIIADLTGKIKQAWLDLTANFTFTGALNIAASASKTLTLNSIAYIFPTTQTASSTSLQTNGSGTLSWEPTWNLLVSTTTTAAMNFATTSFAAVNDIHYVFFAPTMTNNTSPCLRFGTSPTASDSATNYGARTVTNAVTSGGWESAKQGIHLESAVEGATTTDAYFTVDIVNNTSSRKLLSWSGVESNTSSNAPWGMTGSGVWNNTSAQIQTVVLGLADANCATVPTGTVIRVYGQ